MKKLLSILGAVGIVASSATTVVACGGKGGDNEGESLDKSIVATANIAKAMLLSKSENLGNNVADPLWGNSSNLGRLTEDQQKEYTNEIALKSPQYLSRMSRANDVYDKTGYQENMVEESHSWDYAFESKLDPENENYIGGRTSTSTVDSFISSKDGVLVDDTNDSEIDSSLNYLLSDSVRSLRDQKIDESGIPELTTNFTSDNTERKMIAATQAGGLDSDNTFFGIVSNMRPSKIEALVEIVNAMAPIAATHYVESVNHGVKPMPQTDNNGNLRQFLFGSARSAEAWSRQHADAYIGKETGIIPTILEQVYNKYRHLIKDGKFGDYNSQLVEYLFGSSEVKNANGDYELISNVNYSFTNDDGSDMTEAESTVVMRKIGSSESDTFIDAVPNTGLFGKIINLIGNIRWHNPDTVDKSKLTGEGNMGNYGDGKAPGTGALLIDNDIIELQEETIKLVDATKPFLEDENIKTEICDVINHNFVGNGDLLTFLSFLGVDSSAIGTNKIMDFFNLIFAAGKLLLKANINLEITKETDPDDIENTYKEGVGYDRQIMTDLQNAISKIDYEDYLPMVDKTKNADYREAIYNALGVVGKTSFTKGGDGFAEKMSNELKKYSSTLFTESNSLVTWAENIFDKNMFEKNLWKISNQEIKYNESNDIDSVTYTMEYDGLGNDDVAKFKSSNEDALNLSQSEIFHKLNSTNEEDQKWKEQYNGNGDYDHFTDVKRQYTVTWENESDDVSMTDFRLVSLENEKVFIDGQWKEIKY